MCVRGRLEQDVDHLREVFPVEADREHNDGQRYPHGALTSIGLAQTKQLGERLASQYGQLVQSTSRDQVVVRSSNFRRTALSAQSVLSGLLAQRQDLHGDVRVKVEEQGELGTIAAYENLPLLRHLCNHALEHDPVFEVAGRQPHVAEARAALAEHLPHFASDAFRWIHAADYFMCAEGHSIPVPATLQPYRDTAVVHTLFRFATLFESPQRRALAAGGLLGDMLRNMEAAVGHDAGDASSPAPHFAVFSGHDITVLPLLHCLTGRRMREWPPYASAVTVELCRTSDAAEGGNGTAGVGTDDGYAVRVQYNGKPVWLDVPRRYRPERLPNGPLPDPTMVPLAQFRAIAEHYSALARELCAPDGEHMKAMREQEEVGAEASHDDAA